VWVRVYSRTGLTVHCGGGGDLYHNGSSRPMLILRLYTDSYLPMYPGSGKKVCLVVVVCKPILVFYFGPNQALDFG
jgi:hypothetical protein